MNDTDRERLKMAATLAAAFPSGWFIDFVEAREAAYQILGRLAEKGTPLTYDGSASGELSASPDDGANNARRESGSMPAPAADPSPHEPGDPHRYGPIECQVCGQRGQINISIEPQNVPPTSKQMGRDLAELRW